MEETGKKDRNIFFGEGLKAKYASIIYEKLRSREWFTYRDLHERFKEKHPDEQSGEFSKEPNKAFKALESLLHPGDVERVGNNRTMRFRYVGEEDDPLAELMQAKFIDDIKEYWQFCQASAGFFPISWLEHFFAGTMDLLDIKDRKGSGEQVLVSSADRMLTNIELLPILYEAITERKTLKVSYKPYKEPQQELIFHPHLLKEFNGRWHLLGHADGQEPEWGYDLALDRMVGKPEKYYLTKYRPAPKGFYVERFKDVIGTSTSVEKLDDQPYDVRVRAHTKNMFGLTESMKLHESQQTIVPFGEHEGGEYGEFMLHVVVNNEFIGRILQKGATLEVMSPPEVREVFKQRVQELAGRYDQE